MKKIYLKDIHENMEVKNYKEMCKLLRQPDYSTNTAAKHNQLKRWKEHINFEQVAGGRKFLIHEIIENEKKMRFKPAGNKSLYVTYIETIILQFLLGKPSGSVELTSTQLMKQLGMINDKYGDLEYEKQIILCFDEDTATSQKQLDHIKNTANRRFNQIITSALNSMEKRRLIDWERTMKITFDRPENITQVDRTRSKIIKMEQQVMNSLGYSNIGDIQSAGQWREYRSLVENTVRDQLNVVHYSRVIKIWFHDSYILNALEELETKLYKQALNSKTTQALDTTLENDYKNHQKTKLILGSKKGPQEDIFTPNFIAIKNTVLDCLFSYVFSEEIDV